MTTDLNKTVHSGRFVKDPELRMVASPNRGEVPMTKFTLAVNKYISKTKEIKVIFIDFVAYYKQAEFISKWFKKGDEAFVFGRMATRLISSENNPSGKTKVTEIVADEIYFGQRSRANRPANTNNAETEYAPPPPSDEDIPEYIPEDDLPF